MEVLAGIGLPETVFTLLTGGGALGFLVWLFKQARAPVEDYQSLSAERKQDITELKEEIAHLKAEIKLLTKQLHSLEDENRELRYSVDHEKQARLHVERELSALKKKMGD